MTSQGSLLNLMPIIYIYIYIDMQTYRHRSIQAHKHTGTQSQADVETAKQEADVCFVFSICILSQTYITRHP